MHTILFLFMPRYVVDNGARRMFFYNLAKAERYAENHDGEIEDIKDGARFYVER